MMEIDSFKFISAMTQEKPLLASWRVDTIPRD
jgi:hypothetical protein